MGFVDPKYYDKEYIGADPEIFEKVWGSNFLEKIDNIDTLNEMASNAYLYGELAKLYYNSSDKKLPVFKNVPNSHTGFVNHFNHQRVDEDCDFFGQFDRMPDADKFPGVPNAEFAYMIKGQPVYLELYRDDEDMFDPIQTMWIGKEVKVSAEYLGVDSSGFADVQEAIAEGDQNTKRLFQPLFRTPLKLTLFRANRYGTLKLDGDSSLQLRFNQSFTPNEDNTGLESTAMQMKQGLTGEAPKETVKIRYVIDLGNRWDDIVFNHGRFHSGQDVISQVHLEIDGSKMEGMELAHLKDFKRLLYTFGDDIIHPMSGVYFNKFAGEQTSPRYTEEFENMMYGKTGKRYWATDGEFFEYMSSINKPMTFGEAVEKAYSFEIELYGLNK